LALRIGLKIRADRASRAFSPPSILAALLAVWQERRPSEASRACGIWHKAKLGKAASFLASGRAGRMAEGARSKASRKGELRSLLTKIRLL